MLSGIATTCLAWLSFFTSSSRFSGKGCWVGNKVLSCDFKCEFLVGCFVRQMPVHNPQFKCHCIRAVSSDIPVEFHSQLSAVVEFLANSARYPAVFHSPGVAASCKLFRCKEFHCGSLCLQEISLLGSGFNLRIGHCMCIGTTGCFVPRICSFVCLLIA